MNTAYTLRKSETYFIKSQKKSQQIFFFLKTTMKTMYKMKNKYIIILNYYIIIYTIHL